MKGKVSVLGTAILDIGRMASFGYSSNLATTLPVICKSGDFDVEAAFRVLLSHFGLLIVPAWSYYPLGSKCLSTFFIMGYLLSSFVVIFISSLLAL